MTTLPITYEHKQQSSKIGSRQKGGCGGGGGGGGGDGSGDSDGAGYGSDNGSGDGNGNGKGTARVTVIAATTMAMMATTVSMATVVMMVTMVAAVVAVAVVVAEVVMTGVAMAAATHLVDYHDATFVMRTFLTTPTTSMHCRASARGRPPTTDSIRRHIDEDKVCREQ